jgi:anti-anti-sigma regulatory factor
MDGADLLDSLARVADIHGALARAHDPAAFLRAVGEALAPFGPAYVDLAYVHLGADGQPAEFEVVTSWAHGDVAASPIVGGRFPVSGFPIAQLMLRTRGEPRLLPELTAEPALAEVMLAVGRTVASAAILPLFSERQGTWQGVVGVYWTAPHAFDEVERAHLLVRMHLFAETLASKRTLRALREAYERNEALLRRTAATLRETEAKSAMLRVLLDNLPLGVAVVHGETGQRELINHRGAALLGDHAEDAAQIDASVGLVYAPGETTPLAPEALPHAVTLATGETQSTELELERTPGERALIEVTTSLLRYPGDPAPRVILIYQDITDARRRELERLRAQEALLAAQELALAERSTPLLPIREDVLVMPIIGSIDAARGRQIVETLVHLGGSARVRAAILDITGVRELDTAAASTLLGAAQALRLRGVRPIVTGIQPTVAATLVGLGVDLTGIEIRGTLQDAVAHASLAPGR